MKGFVLDTGALIALERGDRRVTGLIERALDRQEQLAVPSGCVAQAWRDGPRQHRLATLLRCSLTVVPELDGEAARRVGELLARSRTADIVDAQVALVALSSGHPVLTSDPEDIRRLAPNADIERV